MQFREIVSVDKIEKTLDDIFPIHNKTVLGFYYDSPHPINMSINYIPLKVESITMYFRNEELPTYLPQEIYLDISAIFNGEHTTLVLDQSDIIAI